MGRTRPKASSSAEYKIEPIELEKLLLDERNPRLAEDSSGATQRDLVKKLWREFAVEEVALSIAHNGFFEYEPLFIEPHPTRPGKWVVVEGNRRLAAVQLLRDKSLREEVGATNLPSITADAAAKLEYLPIVKCEREKVWKFLGFRHINGPQAWSAESKAMYVAHVHNDLKIPLDDIADTIGDTNRTVARLYRAQMILDQAVKAKVFAVDDRAREHFSFSHLYTGLGYEGIQKFVGISEDEPESKHPVPARRMRELEELLLWLYGSKSRKKAALIQSQNPDLRILDATLKSRAGLVALRRGVPLESARDIAKGDQEVFRESLQSARLALQTALGRVVTGYDGEPGPLTDAEALVKVSQTLVAQMSKRAREPK